jgi:hypothetical protein
MKGSMTELEDLLLARTWLLIDREFPNHPEPAEYFHYTAPENIKLIVESQTFHASLIRSSSDALEFALPFSACRDWALERFYKMPNFPLELFKHFNQQAISPYVRPYFVSMCMNNQAKHLKEFYGEGILKVSLNESLVKFNRTVRLVQCRYTKNPYELVYKIMDEWRDDVFHNTMDEFEVSNPVEREIHSQWFYIMMAIFNSISVAIKQAPFSDENEVRLLFYTKDPHQACQYFGEWSTKDLDRSLIRREYIPLKMGELGFKVSEFQKN